MNTTRFACVIGSAIVASTLHAQTIVDDFETHQVGSFPAEGWHDITDRTVGSPAQSPSMSVIETTDAQGNPTIAVQTNQEPGTNGLYQEISTETSFHHLSMNIRVDSMHSANAGWPAGMGYSRYSGEGDVNANPHAVIYVWTGRVWNLFIAPGDGRPAVDLRVNGPSFTVGRWYTLTLDVDVATGRFEAKVFDAVTGDLLNIVSHTYAQWDPEVDSFNSITVFDGGDVNSPVQGQSTIDNVEYTTTSPVTEEDDFESYQIGPVPVGEWKDVFDRVGTPTVPAPTATLISTTDAHGNETKAIQTKAALRSASGVYKDVEEADFHSLSIDVRIDQFSNPGEGWPIGVGFIQDVGFDDVNQNAQALIYAWTDRRWNLFVSQGVDRQAVILTIPTPLLNVGSWYTLTLETYTDRGLFMAIVVDAATGDVLGSATHQVANWDPTRGNYNAITCFDGELPNASSFGQATIDNAVYRSSSLEECTVDFTGDGRLNFFDVAEFLEAYADEDVAADLTGDGAFNFFDVAEFLDAYARGCP